MRYKICLLFLALFALLLLTSCVSGKKYRAALGREEQLNSQVGQLTANVAQLNTRIADLQNENNHMIGQMDSSNKNAARLARMANMTQQQLEDEQRRLTDMRRIMDQQRQAAENLRKKMADALVNFKSNELSVVTKNGKVYVSLQENLLFPSGSAVVNPKGKEALGKLAQVLNTNPDINVAIEGHTDSIPIKGKYEDNWALSVARSTAIVRILTTAYGVDPARVVASGRSKYDPVDSNSTPEGRARNRRTEIILEPKLDELMRLINDTPASSTTSTGTTGSRQQMIFPVLKNEYMEILFSTTLRINNEDIPYEVYFEHEQYVFRSNQSSATLKLFGIKREYDEWLEQEALPPEIKNQAAAALEKYLLAQN